MRATARDLEHLHEVVEDEQPAVIADVVSRALEGIRLSCTAISVPLVFSTVGMLR
jgi:hypothetical protein